MKLTFREGIVLFIASFFFLIFFSTSTSFIGPVVSFDSSIFQLIGKYWNEGVLPYVGLWDSKGPLIFFINAVGYYLTNSYFGVFIIQVLCLFITLTFIYLFFKQAEKQRKAWLQTFFVLIVLSNSIEGGNSVEEYLLPLLVPALFYMYKWSARMATNEDIAHSVRYAFLYGLVLSFSFLTRLTNAIGVCVGAILIFICLVYNKKWGNLLKCVCCFIGGFLLLTIPFVYYFYSRGALSDMWYGTVGYNVGYVSTASYSYYSFKGIMGLLLSYFSCYFLIGVSILTIIFQHDYKRTGWFWLIVSSSTFIYFYNTYRFAHYNIISLPYLCIGMVELERLIEGTSSRSLKKGLKISSYVMNLFLICGCVYQSFQAICQYTESHSTSEYFKSYINQIPKEDLNSFVGYNTTSTYYLDLNICPYYPFFYMQDRTISRNKSLEKKVHDTFEKGDVKWILVDDYSRQCGIQDILDARYKIVKKEGLVLFNLIR